MTRLTLKIHGFVQGVGFRWNIRRLAEESRLVGYVKNLLDGTVEVIAEGEEEQLKKLLEYCKIGPQRAIVEKVEEEWNEIQEKNFNEFNILHN